MNNNNSPITNIKKIYSNFGYITYPFSNTIYFKICKITFEQFEDDSYQYIFKPYYDVLDGLAGIENNDISIPGIDLSLKLEEYYRVNFTPAFVSDRTFSTNRENKFRYLKERGFTYYNRLEYLIDSPYRYAGDSLLVKSDTFFDNLYVHTSSNITKVIRELQILGKRVDYNKSHLEVNSNNRGILIKTLLDIYKDSILELNKKRKANPGRTKIAIDMNYFLQVAKNYQNQEISLKLALSLLGNITESTFYRRLREIKNQLS
jgi:hypothetical protein